VLNSASYLLAFEHTLNSSTSLVLLR